MKHCWQDYQSTLEPGTDEWAKADGEMSKTCMLEDGHSGPHEWTDDDQITVTFRRER
jgi:hypothetical protein